MDAGYCNEREREKKKAKLRKILASLNKQPFLCGNREETNQPTGQLTIEVVKSSWT